MKMKRCLATLLCTVLLFNSFSSPILTYANTGNEEIDNAAVEEVSAPEITPSVTAEVTQSESLEEAAKVTLGEVTPGETPGETESPDATETPSATETPRVTETPEESKTPEPTETPKTTETPGATEAPEETKTPEPTEIPKVTETPGVTETLTPSVTPDDEESEIDIQPSKAKFFDRLSFQVSSFLPALAAIENETDVTVDIRKRAQWVDASNGDAKITLQYSSNSGEFQTIPDMNVVLIHDKSGSMDVNFGYNLAKVQQKWTTTPTKTFYYPILNTNGWTETVKYSGTDTTDIESEGADSYMERINRPNAYTSSSKIGATTGHITVGSETQFNTAWMKNNAPCQLDDHYYLLIKNDNNSKIGAWQMVNGRVLNDIQNTDLHHYVMLSDRDEALEYLADGRRVLRVTSGYYYTGDAEMPKIEVDPDDSDTYAYFLDTSTLDQYNGKWILNTCSEADCQTNDRLSKSQEFMDTLVNEILAVNPDNQIAYVPFWGDVPENGIWGNYNGNSTGTGIDNIDSWNVYEKSHTGDKNGDGIDDTVSRIGFTSTAEELQTQIDNSFTYFGTNWSKAFENAAQLVNELHQDPNEAEKETLVLFLTDGMPHGTEGLDSDYDNPSINGEYINSEGKLDYDTLEEFKSIDGVTVWAIGIGVNNQDKTGLYKRLESIDEKADPFYAQYTSDFDILTNQVVEAINGYIESIYATDAFYQDKLSSYYTLDQTNLDSTWKVLASPSSTTTKGVPTNVYNAVNGTGITHVYVESTKTVYWYIDQVSNGGYDTDGHTFEFPVTFSNYSTSTSGSDKTYAANSSQKITYYTSKNTNTLKTVSISTAPKLLFNRATSKITINKTVTNTSTSARTYRYVCSKTKYTSGTVSNIERTASITVSAGATSGSASITGLSAGTYYIYEVNSSNVIINPTVRSATISFSASITNKASTTYPSITRTDSDGTVSNEKNYLKITSTTRTVSFTGTPYKVRHWQQNADGNPTSKDSTNYTLVETESLYGDGGISVTPAVKSYTSFTSPNTQTVKISGDGSTVVDYYYTRNTNYKVRHWKQNIDGDADTHDSTNYTLATTQNLTGTANESVTPAVKSYTGFKSPSTQTVKISADGSTVIDYYYTRKSYTVTLIKGTGISDVIGAGTYLYGESVTINATVKDGYTWSKWTGTHDTSTQKYTFTMPAANVIDTANASANVYTVVYDKNAEDATGTTESSTHQFDVEKALTANGYSRTGYAFIGWAEKDDGSGASYEDKEVVKNLTSTAGATVTLYAKWEKAPYANKVDHFVVGFLNGEGNNSNGKNWFLGTTKFNKKEGDVFYADESIGTTIPNGYYISKVIGNTNASNSSSYYSILGKKITQLARDMHFQYTYSPINYTITYEMNGGTNNDDNPLTYNVLYGVSFEEPVEREGYTFEGWYIGDENVTGINEGCNATFSSKDDLYTKLASRTTGDITVEARWTPVEYTVVYDKNADNATGTTESSTHKFDVEKALTANGYNRTGYVFTGWTENADGTGASYENQEVVKNLTSKAGATITLYAKWEPDPNTPYKVQHWQLNVDGDADTHDSTNYTLAETQNLTGTANTSVTPAVKNYEGFTSPDTQTVTIKADGTTVVDYYYTRNSYTVTLIKGTGISDVIGAGTYLYGESVTINATVKDGYTWSKWTGTHDTSTQEYTFTMPAANVTDTANATANVYTVVYDKNAEDATGTTDSSTHVFNVEKALTANGYSRTGYIFTGWNSEADGSGISYKDQEIVKNLTSTAGDTVTLYAMWLKAEKVSNGNADGVKPKEEITYTITVVSPEDADKLTITDAIPEGTTYKKDSASNRAAYADGVLTWEFTDVKAGEEVKVSFTVKANDNLAGGTEIKNSATVKIGENDYDTNMVIDKVAEWATVTYDANGGTGDVPVDNTVYTTGDEVTVLDKNTLEKEGYQFAGWNTKTDGSGTHYDPEDTFEITGNVTLYAQWELNKYKLDINHLVDGEDVHNVLDANVGSFKLYLNGVDWFGAIGDYEDMLDYGTSYEIKDINPLPGYIYVGPTGYSGTIGASDNVVWLEWKSSTYEVEFNGNGHTGGSMNNQKFTYNVAQNLTANSYTKTGYIFHGWNTMADGTGTHYDDKEEVKNLATSGTVTLYAQWLKAEKVSNGSTDGVKPKEEIIYTITVVSPEDADKLTITDAIPEGTTYKEGSASNGAAYADGVLTWEFTDVKAGEELKVTFTVKADVNLTAGTEIKNTAKVKIGENDYDTNVVIDKVAEWATVTYDANGGTGEVPVDDKIYSIGDEVTVLSKNTLKKEDYQFAGWNTKADGSGTHYDAEETFEITENTTLYAQWLKIKKVSNGNADGVKPKDEITYTITVVSPEDADKLIITDAIPEGTTYKEGSASEGGAYADGVLTWEFTDVKAGDELKVSFIVVVNEGILADAKIENIASVMVGENGPSYDSNKVVDGSVGNYNIYYELDTDAGEENHPDNPNEYTYGIGVEEFYEPTKPGYEFRGWYEDAEFKTPIESIGTDREGDVTLYPKWSMLIKVIYEGNKATSGTTRTEIVSELDCKDGYQIKENENFTDFERVNFGFTGWDTDKYVSSSEVTYKNKNLPETIGFDDLEQLSLNIGSRSRSNEKVSTTEDDGTEDLPTVTFFAIWDSKPEIYPLGDVLEYYEGEYVTKDMLLEQIKAWDDEDEELTDSIHIIRIEYSEGKLIDGVKQPSYEEAWEDDMPETEVLDTWFLQMEKDAKVTHKIIFEVEDSAGNVTEFEWDIIVKYNEFPRITGEDRYFTLEEAQAGEITLYTLMDTGRAWDEEDCASHCNEGENCLDHETPCDFTVQKLTVLGYDAQKFKEFEESGYVILSYHVIDQYGKEALMQFVVYIMDDGEVVEAPVSKVVRFINAANFEKNVNAEATLPEDDPTTVDINEREEKIKELNKNGGLNVGSIWYTNGSYRTLLESVLEDNPTVKHRWYFVAEEVKMVKNYILNHGIGNSRSENLLSDFMVMIQDQKEV